MPPLVSVIIPTYNRKNIVSNAIDSVLDQTYTDIEIIVVDDGSTDNTHEMIKSYKDKLIFLRQDNKGVAAARNLGVKHSKGTFLAFLDSDDTWHPKKIELQQNMLELAGENIPCCICDTIMIYPDRRVSFFETHALKSNISEGLWVNVEEVASTRFIMLVQAILIRRSALVFPLFNEHLRVMEDDDLALRLASKGPWAYTSQQLVNWHSDSPYSLSMSAQQNPMYLYECIQEIIKKKLSLNDIKNLKVIKNFKRRYWLNTLRLQALQCSVQQTSIKSVFGKLLDIFIRVYEALYRRSNSYPKPIVTLIIPKPH